MDAKQHREQEEDEADVTLRYNPSPPPALANSHSGASGGRGERGRNWINQPKLVPAESEAVPPCPEKRPLQEGIGEYTPVFLSVYPGMVSPCSARCRNIASTMCSLGLACMYTLWFVCWCSHLTPLLSSFLHVYTDPQPPHSNHIEEDPCRETTPLLPSSSHHSTHRQPNSDKGCCVVL